MNKPSPIPPHNGLQISAAWVVDVLRTDIEGCTAAAAPPQLVPPPAFRRGFGARSRRAARAQLSTQPREPHMPRAPWLWPPLLAAAPLSLLPVSVTQGKFYGSTQDSSVNAMCLGMVMLSKYLCFMPG